MFALCHPHLPKMIFLAKIIIFRKGIRLYINSYQIDLWKIIQVVDLIYGWSSTFLLLLFSNLRIFCLQMLAISLPTGSNIDFWDYVLAYCNSKRFFKIFLFFCSFSLYETREHRYSCTCKRGMLRQDCTSKLWKMPSKEVIIFVW